MKLAVTVSLLSLSPLGIALAGPRVANTSITLPQTPPTSIIEIENAFSGLSFSSPLCLRSPVGETKRLFVCEKTGDLELIPDVTAPTPERTLFLDLDQIVTNRGETFLTSSEQGLLSVAFHPDYASNGQFFVVYNVRVGGVNYQRLSRWHDPDRSDTQADPNSETVLIEMVNDASNHNGGDLHFGPDGYLYMSWGDEGSQNDFLNNSQFLDKDFWSSIIRIDVDLETEDNTAADGSGSDDENLRPNTHPAVKLVDGNPNYEIPADNPWVGATSFNGVTVDPSQTRTEFFALGLRNPWRMSFDGSELWVGDVGQGAREEITLAASGSNHGWAWYEGSLNGPKFNNSINGASRTSALHTPPVWDYRHGSGEFQGSSVTGGFVYRGSNIPTLTGKYIFADYVSGNIWALTRTDTPGKPEIERIAGENGIAGFGPDPSNGDILMADLGSNVIQRIVTRDLDANFPETLSATGIFSNLTSLTPNPGVVPYEVNLPFWSDHALKQRWFAIKNTTDLISFSADDPWAFPTGMVWVKHFELELERGNPATRKRIETRVIVRNQSDLIDGIYGVSYRWNEAQTEATLVRSAGENFDLSFTTPDGVRNQTWSIPSRASCLACHTEKAGFALSFNTPQLNHPGTLEGSPGNFLTLLHSSGYLDQDPGLPLALPRHVTPEESTYSLEARVRSYLEVNCSYCHQQGGVQPESWFGNLDLTLHQTGLINGSLSGGSQDPSDRLVVPGNPSRSVLLSRISTTNGYTRMPPLATNESDLIAIELLRDWINQEASEVTSYHTWRIARFGNETSPRGEPKADPDGDSYSNEAEYLAQTDPIDGNDFLLTGFSRSDAKIEIDLPRLPNRSVTIERSTDLSNWLTWTAATNNGIPRNPEQQSLPLSAPASGDWEYFRLRIKER